MSWPEIRVGGPGGLWLSAVGLWGDLTVEHRWPYGCWEVDWSMTSITTKKRPPALATNTPVDVFLGRHPIWSGQLTEPDWNSGQFVAQGWVRQGETAPCLTSGGLTTSVPNTAIDNAIAKGWVGWMRPTSISSTAYAATDTGTGDATDNLNTITALMDAYTQENQLRWGVDALQRVWTAPDPTSATWDISPETNALGVSSAALATSIAARYIADNVGTLATVVIGTGGPVALVDLTSRGQITLTRATTICNAILAQTAGTTGWTNGLTLTRDQIMGGGTHPNLGLVVAGQRVRLRGQRDPRGLDANTSAVIGTSLWHVADGTIDLTPTDLIGRDLSTIIAKQGGALVS